MFYKHKQWSRLTLSGLLLLASSTCALEDPAAKSAKSWTYSFSLGLMQWDDLQDLKPVQGGTFDSIGYSLEMAAHREVTQWGQADVLVGADLGLFTTDSDIRGRSENLTQRGLYLTPSVKLRFGEPGQRYWNLETGLGWYEVDFAELDCSFFPCLELEDSFNRDRLGGYLGISVGIGRWFILGLKAHHADFGRHRGFGAGAGDLQGPFYILSVGAAFTP